MVVHPKIRRKFVFSHHVVIHDSIADPSNLKTASTI